MACVFWMFSVFSKNIYIKTLGILNVVSYDSDASESPTGSSYELTAVPAHYVVVREAKLCTYTLNQTELSQPPWFGGCRRWTDDLAVVGSIPRRQNCGT